ncbi:MULTISPECIES: SDR family NAD(P)-dependent oxidoreductase [Pseudomonas]|nr:MULTISPECIES: SDR family NAD(P)-dependent oxidoreductase [Pseudomonas]MBZ6454884.1 SDR family oxidoreductase [Pseudomonas fluorescens group sp.]MBZ6462072.1 SDR family oxidoreductase [Pseudomonas fluorescens group sp.]MBZ6467400.1 SDR family oxidoreductase [Pseudomonas fluorescens group sp.]QUE92611.1 SDR family oxidoreductase [Pseudomonas sp. SCA2728.1_7]WQD74238.1 SDR family oxidoreductase [Pseudomonas marginalis]
MFPSNSRIAVVNGVASGLGKVFALLLAAAGFNLALTDPEPADGTVAEIIEHGGTAWAQCCDLVDLPLSRVSRRRYWRDSGAAMLVNNAAFTPFLRSLAETDVDTW